MALCNPKLADCMLLVGPDEKEVPASRAMLARNCEVFERMFTSGMVESQAFDKKTGEKVPVLLPKEDYETFQLFGHMLCGNIKELPEGTTADTFGKFADAMDRYLIESGPLIAACTNLLLTKVNEEDFFDYVFAYRGEHSPRPLALAVTSAITEAAFQSTLKLPGDAFVEKCTEEDINAITKGYCRKGPMRAVLRDDVKGFITNRLVPGVRRLTGLKISAPVSSVDRKLNTDMFSETVSYSYPLTRFGAMIMLNRSLDGNLSDMPVGADVEARLHWDDDLDGLMMKVLFKQAQWIDVADGGMPRPSPTGVPVEFYETQVMTYLELKELQANEVDKGPDNGELVNFRIKMRVYHAQTLLQFYMLRYLSGMLLVHPSGTFFQLLRSSKFTDWWDEKLTATALVGKLLQHLESKSAKSLDSDSMKEIFKHRIPWIYVKPEQLMHCMRIPKRLTGMGNDEWGMIMKTLMEEGRNWHLTNLRVRDEGGRLMFPKNLSVALVKGLKRKAESDADESSSSNKKARVNIGG